MSNSRSSFTPAQNPTQEFVEDKVRYLEKRLDVLQADMDMKMQIMGQILSTRNEQFLVQKKLIEKEHALYENVMTHWKNISDLAASGHSIRYSKNTEDFQVVDTSKPQDSVQNSAKRSLTSAGLKSSSQRTRLTAKRLRNSTHGHIHAKTEPGEQYDDADLDSDSEAHDSLDPAFEVNSGAESDEVVADGDDIETGMEKRVFVNFYSENPANPEEGSSDEIWLHYLREENTATEQGMIALCKHCEAKGFQKLYQLKNPGLGILRGHLKRKHKINVAPPPVELPVKPNRSENLAGFRKANYVRHNNKIYKKYQENLRSSTEYWRCREHGLCSGKMLRRKGGEIEVTAEHTCETSSADCDALEFRERIKELAESNPTLPVSEVIAIAKQGCTQEVLEIIPPDSSLRKTIRKIHQTLIESVAEATSSWT